MKWYDNLIEWFKSLFKDFTEFSKDAPIKATDDALKVISDSINSISVPDFAANGLQSAISSFPSSVLWAMSITNVPECLAIIGTAVVFRLGRKLATLGRW